MIYTNKNIPVEIGKNVKISYSVAGFREKTSNVFELVFFENGMEKMVLAEGSAAFMQWTKNEMRNSSPYNHGLLCVRHKRVYQFEANAGGKHSSIRLRASLKRRYAIKRQKETSSTKQLVLLVVMV